MKRKSMSETQVILAIADGEGDAERTQVAKNREDFDDQLQQTIAFCEQNR
jgi:hypothetical protein